MLALAIQTGLRVSELTGLNIGDIALGPEPSLTCQGVGRRQRAVPLAANIKDGSGPLDLMPAISRENPSTAVASGGAHDDHASLAVSLSGPCPERCWKMAETARLDQAGSWDGYWWLPGEPKRRFPGTLTYQPEGGVRLSLIGGFGGRPLANDQTGELSFEKGPWPVIFGEAERTGITLLDCYSVTSRTRGLSLDGPESQMVAADTALIGVRLVAPDQALFTECRVWVENLHAWATSSGLTPRYEFIEGQLGHRADISIEPVPERWADIGGATVSLAHWYSFPSTLKHRGERIGQIRETSSIGIRPHQPCALADARDYGIAIQDLITLACYAPAGLLRMDLSVATEDAGPEDTVAVLIDQPVPGNAEADQIPGREMLFTCEHLTFDEVMPRWFTLRSKLRDGVNMFLGSHYAPADYVEGQLLMAVGAAEVLHRLLAPKMTRVSPAEFKKLRHGILEATHSEHQEWVRSALRNDPTLRDRLFNIASLPDSQAIRALVPDIAEWAKQTSKARNDLAHTGKTRLPPGGLIAVVHVTTAVVALNLLHELGAPPDRQLQIIRDNRKLRAAARMAVDRLSQRPLVQPSDPPSGWIKN